MNSNIQDTLNSTNLCKLSIQRKTFRRAFSQVKQTFEAGYTTVSKEE